VALGGDLTTSFGGTRQRPVQAVRGGGAANLPARTTTTGWHGDVDRGGEVATSDRPGRDDHAYKSAAPSSRLAHGVDVPSVL
jgi:hypothetical protein